MKTYFVIGLGRFGSSVARRLYELGYEVLILDDDEELVRQSADFSTHAAIGDAREMSVLKAAGAGDCDCAIVAIGSDLAASIVITMNLRDLGVSRIICKARDDMYKRALERIGADQVLIPEKEMAVRLVQSLDSGSFLDYIEFSEEYGIAELEPPKNWIGKNLATLNVRSRYRVNVLALKDEGTGELNITPGAGDVITADVTVILMGRNEDLDLLRRV